MFVSVDIDADDVLSELDDEDLVDELKKRNYFKQSREQTSTDKCIEHIKEEFEKGGDSFKRTLCDLLGLNRHSSNEDILNEINRQLS